MNFLGGKTTRPQQAAPATTLRIQTSVAGQPRALGWGQARLAGNLIWYDDFLATPQASPSGSAGKGLGATGGGKGQSGPTSYTYSAAVMIGLAEGPITDVRALWNNKTKQSLGSLNFIIGSGAYTASPWAYLTSHHPNDAFNYRGLAWVAAGPLQLGTNPELPNLNWEVLFAKNNAIPGKPDADPADIVKDLLTNAFYGLGFPSTRIDALTTYSNYCRAAGLVLSPILAQQTAANSFLADIATATNSEFVWSGSRLTLVPYGDSALSANGATYTPPAQALYSLTDDDFLPNQSGSGISSSSFSSNDPILVTRKSQTTQLNAIRVEYLDRANDYNPQIAEAKDDAAIQLYGEKASDTKQLHMFCDAAAALLSTQLQLGRQQIRRMFSFTVGPEYILLDPMDIVEINDANLGLVNQWVRILEITENDDRSLSITAEEYLSGTGSTPVYGQQGNAGYVPDYNVDPGNANEPIMFAAPVALAGGNGLAIWVAVSGSGASWGSADVWVSSDGETYRKIGRAVQPARMGVLSALFSTGTDPDTTNTCSVDLTESKGALLGGTQDDADQANTLCYVDGEFIAYEQATLTAENKYDLGKSGTNPGYLRRGLYNSKIGPHLQGAPFTRCDDALVSIPYTKDQIGTTISVKLTSLNTWDGGEQELADVPVYTIKLPAPPEPPNVANFKVTQNGETVAFSWTDVADDAVIGYDIRYGAAGVSDWNVMLPLTEASRATEMTNASVPPGTWNFAIRAHDLVDQLSPIPSFQTFTVNNTHVPISVDAQEPAWDGTLTGFYKHYSGVLVPLSSVMASAGVTGFEVFDNFVYKPVSTCSYVSPTFTYDKVAQLRISAVCQGKLGPGSAGSFAPTTQLRYALSGEEDVNMWTADADTMWNEDESTPMWSDISDWFLWTIGLINTNLFQMQIVFDTSAGLPVVSKFDITVDQPIFTDGGSGIPIAAGGSRINFSNSNFLQPPFVSPSVDTVNGGGSGTITAVDVDANGFTAHIFNASDQDVGGTGNFSAHN